MKKNGKNKTWAELKKAKSMAEGLAVASVLINQAAYKTGKFLYGLNTPKPSASNTSSQPSAAHKTTEMTGPHTETGIPAETTITAERIAASAHHQETHAGQEAMSASHYHTDGTKEHNDAPAARVEAELIYSDDENGLATVSTSVSEGSTDQAELTTVSAETEAQATEKARPNTEPLSPFTKGLLQLDHDLRTLKSEYEKALSDTEKNVIHFKILRLERKRREYLSRGDNN
ncbi:MAG TPA: hypothetical protein GXX62_10055 [Alcaligenaceae bacterium]|nr:hypothetical protein [Alcaligenaceae bacterium]